MLYSEANRLRNRWRIVAGSLSLALVYVLLAAIPAFALTYAGPDDGAGKYAHCSVYVYYSSISSNPLQEFACQYTLGNGPSGASPTNTVTSITFGTWTYSCNGTCSNSASGTTSTFSSFDTDSAGHLLRNTGSFGLNGAGSIVSASYSGCNVTFSNGGIGGVPVGASACVIDSVTINSAPNPPNYPTNFYPGSTAGPALDSSATTACSRTLTDTTAMTGSFTATNTTANVTVGAPDWDWGDSTTHGTTLTKNHTYGALSTMPTGGWTATLTQTFTVTSGHLFADGTSSKVVTCQLRVDFLHPDKSTVGSNDNSSTGDAGLDACLPSGWNLLNPLALVGSMGCVLKFLFIPSSTTVSSLGHLWDTATTHVPFSIVNDVVTYIPATLDDMQDGISAYSPILGYNHDVSHDVAHSPVCDAGAGGINLCGTGHYPFAGSYFDIHGFAGCSGSACLVGNAIPLAIRVVLMFVITALFIYACWRGAGEILK